MNNDFKFFVPADIRKGKDASGKEVMFVSGIASTNSEDSQGETLDVNNFDLKDFHQINWNHKGSSDPSAVIGEPTKAEVVNKSKLYIEGVLYDDVPMAKAVYNLMKALKKSPSGRKLGMSIEGKVVERASSDKKSPLYNKITKAKITGVAICPHPINGDTVVDLLQKGFTKDESEYEYDQVLEKAIKYIEDNNSDDFDFELEKSEKIFLRKSQIYDEIFSYFGTVNKEQVESVHKIAQKLSQMENNSGITKETLNKAFEILNLASKEVEVQPKKEEGTQIENQDDLIKSFTDMQTSLNAKFAAMGDLFLFQNEKIESLVSDNLAKSEQIDALLKSNETLAEKLTDILQVRNAARSLVKANSVEKFVDTVGGQPQKRVYDIADKNQKRDLINFLQEESGINKSRGGEDIDRELAVLAQSIEVANTATISKSLAAKIANLGIEIVKSR